MTELKPNLSKGVLPIGTAISAMLLTMGALLWIIDQQNLLKSELMMLATREMTLLRDEMITWREEHVLRIHDGAASIGDLADVKVELRAINAKLDQLILDRRR